MTLMKRSLAFVRLSLGLNIVWNNRANEPTHYNVLIQNSRILYLESFHVQFDELAVCR